MLEVFTILFNCAKMIFHCSAVFSKVRDSLVLYLTLIKVYVSQRWRVKVICSSRNRSCFFSASLDQFITIFQRVGLLQKSQKLLSKRGRKKVTPRPKSGAV